MPDIKRIHWLENLRRTEKFGYPGVRFAGIYLVDKVNRPNVFGVFARYRDHEREHKQYPYIDGIYISAEMTEGNPLHEICTGAHEVGHWKLRKDGDEKSIQIELRLPSSIESISVGLPSTISVPRGR